MKKFAFGGIAFLALWLPMAYAHITVLEYKTEADDDLHAQSVRWIACKNSSVPCRLQYLDQFDDPEFLTEWQNNIELSQVVNMSFTVQKPPPPSDRPRYAQTAESEMEEKKKHQQVTLEYEQGSAIVSQWIHDNPQVLFVTGAGNGVPLSGGFQSKGVALGPKTLIFPQILQAENLVKVASIDQTEFSLKNPTPYSLTDYSNYGLDLVEVAAPVEPNGDGVLIGGTSFAAPYVTRLVAKIQTQAPGLKPSEIRQILLRSCHIADVAKAIWATEDFQTRGEASIIYQAHFHRMRAERERLQKEELADVLLVACGGVIVDELALQCAARLEGQKTRDKESINQACLEARRASAHLTPKDEDQLRKLWTLRQL